MQFLSFKDAVEAIKKDLHKDLGTDLSLAVATALTRTAVKCRNRMSDHAKEAFDRPTRFTLNAFMAVPATPKRLSAAVLLKPGSGSSMTPAENYLGPEIVGGVRRQKRSERALAAVGLISQGAYVMPGKGARLDQYGNQSRAEIVKILSVLRAFGEQGYKANRTARWGRQNRNGQIFVIREGASHPGLKPGVYQRIADGKVKPLMIFTNTVPNYKIRLPITQLIQNDADKIFPHELSIALLESAKWKE